MHIACVVRKGERRFMSTAASEASAVKCMLPGSTEFTGLLAEIAAGAKDRDLNDENPFKQVDALKRAGFGALRLPEAFGGPGLTVRQQYSAVIDVAHAD